MKISETCQSNTYRIKKNTQHYKNKETTRNCGHRCKMSQEFIAEY